MNLLGRFIGCAVAALTLLPLSAQNPGWKTVV